MPEMVASEDPVMLQIKEDEETWRRLRKKMNKLNLPGIVHDIIAECDHIQMWQVETILPILSNHVVVLDRRMESEKKEILRKKVVEEQHFFWQIAREKKARPPPADQKG